MKAGGLFVTWHASVTTVSANAPDLKEAAKTRGSGPGLPLLNAVIMVGGSQKKPTAEALASRHIFAPSSQDLIHSPPRPSEKM
jgi:hypothetical protein